MVKNDNYMKNGPKGQPSIGKLTFRTIKEMNTQIAELLTGGIDWIWDVPKDQAEKLKDSGRATVTNAKTMRISYIAFDVDGDSGDTAFKNKKFAKLLHMRLTASRLLKTSWDQHRL